MSATYKDFMPANVLRDEAITALGCFEDDIVVEGVKLLEHEVESAFI